MSSSPENTERDRSAEQKPDKIAIDKRALSAFVLYLQGVPTNSIASAFGVTIRTVQRWIKELRDEHHDMVFPDIDALKKRLQTMAPLALDALEDFLGSKIHRMQNASQVMKGIEHVLKTYDVVKDKTTVELEHSKMSDKELLEMLNSLGKGKNG